MALTMLQGAPRPLQDGSKWPTKQLPQDAPKRPKSFQNLRKINPRAPMRPQEAPGGPNWRRRGLQEAPNRSPRGLKKQSRHPRRSKRRPGPPTGPQDAPRGLHWGTLP
eukprot:2397321-Pyramimonas_sp.AAC.1